MMCILELACVIFGIVVLVRGQIPLSATREVRGAPAYLIGMVLISVLPIAFMVGFVIGFRAVQQGKAVAPDLSTVLIELGIVVGCALTALVIALVSAKPKKRKRRRRRTIDEEDYDDYERDRPHRSRDDEDEEIRRAFRRRNGLGDEDDRPRRRRDDDYDDEDDRPRRRRDDLDDRAR